MDMHGLRHYLHPCHWQQRPSIRSGQWAPFAIPIKITAGERRKELARLRALPGSMFEEDKGRVP